jgi:hypothetical protein
MKLLTLTTSALAIAALPVLAQSNIENTAEDIGQSANEMAEETGKTVNDALQDAGQALDNAADATGAAVNEAAQDAEQALDNAAETTGQMMNEAAENTEQTMENIEQEMDKAAQQALMGDAQSDFIRASDIMNGEVYTTAGTNDTWVEQFMYPEVSAEWTRIGSIKDIALDETGALIGVVAEVGGFLDIGDKHIMIPLETLNMAADGEHYALVTDRPLEELRDWPSVEEPIWD